MVKWLLANHCMLPLPNVKKIEKQSCRYYSFLFLFFFLFLIGKQLRNSMGFGPNHAILMAMGMGSTI
jgi:hypothetical protein